MYNNRASETAKQDVTCGVGFLLASRDASLAFIDLFYDKDTLQPATPEQMKADWDTAAGILRTSWPNSNLESTPTRDGYADRCQLRMYPEKVIARRNEIMAQKLKQALIDCPKIGGFYGFPAQAQVAVASYCYGFSPTRAPNFCQALSVWDFDEAGKQSYLAGLAKLKLLHHRILFWNAARIVEQRLGLDVLPLEAKAPALIPWKPWTRQLTYRVPGADGPDIETVQITAEPTPPNSSP